MPQFFPCPYLGAEVELTDEREAHIRQKHVHALGRDGALIAETLESPDSVRVVKQTLVLFRVGMMTWNGVNTWSSL